jgi:hypothetical protein
VVEALVVPVDHTMRAQLGFQEYQDQILYLELLLLQEEALAKEALLHKWVQLVDLEAARHQPPRPLVILEQQGKVLLAVMVLTMVAMDITEVVAVLRLLEPME